MQLLTLSYEPSMPQPCQQNMLMSLAAVKLRPDAFPHVFCKC